MRSPWIVLPAFALAVACAGARPEPTRETTHTISMDHARHGAHARPLLYESLGTYSYRITTASPEAQRWFDQGLRLVYAFNHHEAQRAFREAARLDPACAMCSWGLAITEGSNYNDPTTGEREKRALQAVQDATKLAANARPEERALIEALARRHSADPAAKREALDRAYADAMREVAARYPHDLEAATFFADAMMNLRPWNLWTPDGAPHPGTEEIVRTLERVLAQRPDHPGALHLYIHAVEAGPEPGRGEAAADRLRGLMPGAGHIVHMPSHIYWRVGRYADAVAVNTSAVQADRAYFETAQPSPIYRGLYYPHNIDFIWQSASMEGRSAETIRAAREFADNAPAEMIEQMPDMETAPVAPIVALVRFGRWSEVLAYPAPLREWLYTSGVWRYARGIALVRTDRMDEARRELGELESIIQSVPAERTIAFFFRARNVLQMAANLPEIVYREDLRRNPGNGWSLFGLAQSLRAQGHDAEASDAEQRFRNAWSRADVTLTASRF
jgi:tetratricopeptide (TPR) repeat protein